MENTEQGKETSKVETEVADLRDQGRAHRTSRGQGPVPRGHRATYPGSGWRTQASRLTGDWPANPNRRARVVQGDPSTQTPRCSCLGESMPPLPAGIRPRRRRSTATPGRGAPQGRVPDSRAGSSVLFQLQW